MREGSALEVLCTFLKLGATSFGGPAAHVGYFREEIVVRRRWVDDAAYTDLVALCQSFRDRRAVRSVNRWGSFARVTGVLLPLGLDLPSHRLC